MSADTNLLQGVGVGLRACHYAHIETEHPSVPWFEVLCDNYLSQEGPSIAHLEAIAKLYPLTFHSVGMSIGSIDPLNLTYLSQLKSLIARFKPLLVSDHLCWTSLAGNYFHELLPLPYTEEAVHHAAKRISNIQDFLGRRLMIENVSSYLSFKHSHLTEWEFLKAVSDEADCLILLDINNIYVSACNNEFNAKDYLNQLNMTRVAQFHLAGFEDKGTHLLDNHSQAIHASVWELYSQALKKFGPVPTSIEWDTDIPDFYRLDQERKKAQKLMDELCHPYPNYKKTLLMV